MITVGFPWRGNRETTPIIREPARNRQPGPMSRSGRPPTHQVKPVGEVSPPYLRGVVRTQQLPSVYAPRRSRPRPDRITSTHDARGALSGIPRTLLDLASSQGCVLEERAPRLGRRSHRGRGASHFPTCPNLTCSSSSWLASRMQGCVTSSLAVWRQRCTGSLERRTTSISSFLSLPESEPPSRPPSPKRSSTSHRPRWSRQNQGGLHAATSRSSITRRDSRPTSTSWETTSCTLLHSVALTSIGSATALFPSLHPSTSSFASSSSTARVARRSTYETSAPCWMSQRI